MKIFALIIPGIIGTIIYIVGSLFKIMHWPGASFIQFIGAFLVLLSAILILVKVFFNNKKQSSN
ncbi:GldL-related protein [Flavobacterium cerinum]|uniref:GldL-related protein n=1 Tax=Flavobacterium cerinum TaxID=2502784 RepID=UPI00269A7094